MTDRYKELLNNYRVVERVEENLKTKSEKDCLKMYESELSSIQNNWSDFSGDCAGHGNICLQLMIEYIKIR